MEKRGQVAIFVIVAIVIFILILLYVTIFKPFSSQTSAESIPNEIMPFYNFVRSCTVNTGLNGSIKLGESGGYYLLPKNLTFDNLPIYYINHSNYVPTTEQLGNQLSLYVQNNLNNCLSNFSSLPQYSVNAGKITAKTTIDSNETIIDLSWSVFVTRAGVTYGIKTFNNNIVPIREGTLQMAANDIINSVNSNPSELCLTCMNQIGAKYNVQISARDIGNKTAIIQITDYQISGKSINYRLRFAIKYE